MAPLNQPPAELSPEVRAAAQQASTEAFHLAMLAAALLLAGAAVNGVGSATPQRPVGTWDQGRATTRGGVGDPSGPVPARAQEDSKQQPPADPPGPTRPN